MTTVAMPWSGEDETLFRALLAAVLAATLLLSVVMPFIPVPEIAREIQEQLPAHFAEIILDKPEPTTVAKVAEPEPEPEPEPDPEVREEARPETVVEEAVVAPVAQTVAQAREKAKTSGILAFRDELMDLRDAIDTSALDQTEAVQRGAGEAASVDRSLLTSSAGEKLAGVNVAALSLETGGVALSGRETTVVEAPEEERVERTGAVRLVRPDHLSTRSIEDVRRVFDANKGAIYAIYNRALRANPGLLGKVVLELVIEADGTVSECSVVASEISDQQMITKIVRRVQLFDFGERDVAVTRISYPVHFLPG